LHTSPENNQATNVNHTMNLMKNMSVIFLLLLCLINFFILESCNRFYAITHPRYPVPESFSDTLESIQGRLDAIDSSNYIVYSYISGNCFGKGFISFAKIIWLERGNIHCRMLSKKAGQKKIKDSSFVCNENQALNFFSANRIDTINSLPLNADMGMDPGTTTVLKVKKEQIHFNRQFDQYGFWSTSDTLHPLYIFAKSILNE
jgi:hypothetical protein